MESRVSWQLRAEKKGVVTIEAITLVYFWESTRS
jgi:hypothetical protein